MSDVKIGPARIVSELTGPVKVMDGDEVIRTFGSDRPAQAFASGYNAGWWRRALNATAPHPKARR